MTGGGRGRRWRISRDCRTLNQILRQRYILRRGKYTDTFPDHLHIPKCINKTIHDSPVRHTSCWEHGIQRRETDKTQRRAEEEGGRGRGATTAAAGAGAQGVTGAETGTETQDKDGEDTGSEDRRLTELARAWRHRAHLQQQHGETTWRREGRPRRVSTRLPMRLAALDLVLVAGGEQRRQHATLDAEQLVQRLRAFLNVGGLTIGGPERWVEEAMWNLTTEGMEEEFWRARLKARLLSLGLFRRPLPASMSGAARAARTEEGDIDDMITGLLRSTWWRAQHGAGINIIGVIPSLQQAWKRGHGQEGGRGATDTRTGPLHRVVDEECRLQRAVRVPLDLDRMWKRYLLLHAAFAKKKPGKADAFRLLVDLSNWDAAHGTRDGINMYAADVEPVLLHTAADLVRYINTLDTDAIVVGSVCDVSAAFRQIAIRPQDWPLTQYSDGADDVWDTTLPMGCSTSPFLLCESTNALGHVIEAECTTDDWDVRVWVFMDDMCITLHKRTGGVTRRMKRAARHRLQHAIRLADAAGLPFKAAKIVNPTPHHTLVWIGFQIDLRHRTITVTDARKKKLTAKIWSCLRRRQRWSFVATLAGQLGFAAQALWQGRSLLSNIHSWLHPQPDRPDAVCDRMPMATRRELRMWLTTLSRPTASAHFPRRYVTPDIVIDTDASLDGFGIVMHGGGAVRGVWNVDITASAWMTTLEFTTIVNAITDVYGDQLHGRTVLIRTDNEACVHAVRRLSWRVPHLQLQMQRLVRHMLRHDIWLQVEHIYSVDNHLPDWLSRHCTDEPPTSLLSQTHTTSIRTTRACPPHPTPASVFELYGSAPRCEDHA